MFSSKISSTTSVIAMREADSAMTILQLQVCEQENSGREPKWHPDSWRSWLVCAAGAISVVIVSGVAYCFGLLLPILMENFQATRQQTAWIGTLYLASGSIFSPLGSYFTDRFSYRFTAVLGSVAGIIGFSLASFSSTFWMMYITYGLLSGFGHIMIFYSSYVAILEYFVKRRSLAVGIVSSGPAIGIFVMTQFTQAMLNAFGWQWTVRGFSFLFFVCCLCSTVFVPLDKRREESTNKKTSQEERQISSLFQNRSFLILLTSLTIVHFSYYVPYVHIIKHCAQDLHIPGNKSSMLFTYFAITSFFSRHLVCKLGDMRYFNRFHLYQGGLAIAGLCVLCLPIARSFNSIMVIFLVCGLMDGCLQGQWTLLIFECVGRHKVNQAVGYVMFFLGFTVVTGPALAGLMADKLGSYAPSFYTMGAITIVGASITSLMAFVKQQPEESLKTESYSEELLVTEKVTVL